MRVPWTMLPMKTVTRFAPSPTGLLHLGHAHSALFGWQAARERGGLFLLRIEDIDPGRCRLEFELSLMEDLSWLGLSWRARLQPGESVLVLGANGALGSIAVQTPRVLGAGRVPPRRPHRPPAVAGAVTRRRSAGPSGVRRSALATRGCGPLVKVSPPSPR